MSIKLPIEAPSHGAFEVDPKWPVEGKIKFEQFAVRYREGLDLVLRGIDASIGASEKVALLAHAFSV